MTRYPLRVFACVHVSVYASGRRVAQPCCTGPSAVCNSVFIILFLYMIILILIVSIPCIFVIIYMHYHMSAHSLTELVWWF